MQLDVAEALRDGSAAALRHGRGAGAAQQARIHRELGTLRPAEQTVQRLAGHLAGKVPQRDIDAGERIHDRAVAAEQMQRALQIAHQRVDVARVAPDQYRADQRVEHGPGAGRDRVSERLAPAGDPLIGLDPHQQHAQARSRAAGDGLQPAGRAIRDSEQDGFDRGDLHCVSFAELAPA